MALSCMISEIKPDIGRESRLFFHTPAFDVRITGVPVGILPEFSVWKNRTVWLVDCDKSLRIWLLLLMQYRNGIGRIDV